MLNLTAIAVEATSMTLKIDLSEEIKNNKAARFIQLFVRSLSSKDDFKTFTHVAPISNVLPKQQTSTVQLTKLSQHTVYKVSAAVGDGTFFGNRTKEITLETKGLVIFWFSNIIGLVWETFFAESLKPVCREPFQLICVTFFNMERTVVQRANTLKRIL